MAPRRRGGKGRKKTVIEPIVNEEARHICVSKRRRGLFNKASELAILTGAQVAAIVFTPGGKAFAFGHPSVDAVAQRFLQGDDGVQHAADDEVDDDKLQNLYRQHGELRAELLELNKRKKGMREAMAEEHAAGNQMVGWVEGDVRDLGEEDMAAFAAALIKLQAVISERANQVLLQALNLQHVDVSRMVHGAAPPPPPQLFGGSSTFELGSSSNANANAGMEMAMPATPVLDDAGMDTEEMMLALSPLRGFDAGMDMEQMMLPPAAPQGFDAGMDMEQLMMEMHPPLGLDAGMEMEQQGNGLDADVPY